ncbi:MAG: tRNA epoxyqueuosine(34) reductase QueG [Caldithrix sp.]|nr:tRNA epoxyqueuosine(34) reductase QueG [Caldithrix sp.]
MITKIALSKYIKQTALELGFHKVGIAAAGPLPHSEYLIEWLYKGYHGSMHWMEKYLDKRLDVHKLYPPAKSVIAVAQNYYTPYSHSQNPEQAKISRYAWGRDYHKIMKKKLKELLYRIQERDQSIDGRLFVDTAPIQDKLWAQEAGIGWQGKNTNILTKDLGSWIFLGELVINKILIYDDKISDHCGSCSACIDACPTNALQPYKLDATKCLSFLTIEHWDAPIPKEFHKKMNNWVFGCDICQDVCPWNRFAKESDEQAYYPVANNHRITLAELEVLSEEEFKKRFKNSAVLRAKFTNFMRNVHTISKAQSR